MNPEYRDDLGKRVREIRAQKQFENGETLILRPWNSLDERERESDRAIGEALYLLGFTDAAIDGAWLDHTGAELADEIAEKFYPKNDTAAIGGEPTRGRGECMRDLGIFLAFLRGALAEAGAIIDENTSDGR